jgi:hypothetical protein
VRGWVGRRTEETVVANALPRTSEGELVEVVVGQTVLDWAGLRMRGGIGGERERV